MAVQGALAASSASPLEVDTPPDFFKCDCDAKALSHRDVVCRDEFATVALSLLRFIGAAYTTGDSGCWEAAYRLADDRAGTSDGPLLVARAAALARVIRHCRDRDLAYLPSSCNRLSIEEAQLMVLIEAARNGDPAELSIAVSRLAEIEHRAETIRAAIALADLSRRPAMRRLQRYAGHDRAAMVANIREGRRTRQLNRAS